ncbi:MAG: DUF3365 domain-containing protein [Planctomycetaceae bacterium]|nr:DUF3365 domain-containing protein [Planctomycetaceae bacterium]
MKRLNTNMAMVALAAMVLSTFSGCSRSEAEAPAATSSGGISPQKFADAVHAVMMADRTVYAKQVVTRLKKQDAPVSPSEYWQDEDHTIPLPAQMFRMGAEIVNEDPTAGFTYSLTSQWPLNPQHQAKGVEVEGLKFLAENPGENFYSEEEIAGKKYFTALYADKAVAEACWTCHNEHANRGADYPEFKEGDVMGGVVVRLPID